MSMRFIVTHYRDSESLGNYRESMRVCWHDKGNLPTQEVARHSSDCYWDCYCATLSCRCRNEIKLETSDDDNRSSISRDWRSSWFTPSLVFSPSLISFINRCPKWMSGPPTARYAQDPCEDWTSAHCKFSESFIKSFRLSVTTLLLSRKLYIFMWPESFFTDLSGIWFRLAAGTIPDETTQNVINPFANDNCNCCSSPFYNTIISISTFWN